MLAADRSVFWTIGHNLALTGQPHHSGIVVRLPDGQMALLEAGPHDTLYVELVRVLPSLRAYESEGWVWIRKRVNPLTCEESDRLTIFALDEAGKRFAVLRMAAQMTPFRTRGPVRTSYIGRPAGDRRSYFCSELVTEACVAAGLISADNARPSATFPRDLFMDRSRNAYLNCHFKLAPDWAPPARWLSSPCSGSSPGSHHREKLFQHESEIADMLIDPACHR
jgi:hypothetical protein